MLELVVKVWYNVYILNLGGAEMEVYTTKELAEKLKINIVTARKLIRNGEIEAKKVGKGYRITENQLRQYLEGDSQGPTPREKNMSLDK